MATWRTRDGREMDVREMTDDHLRNAIRYLERNEERLRTAAAFQMSCAAERMEGTIASMSLDSAAEELWSGEVSLEEWNQDYADLVEEAECRGLEL